MALRDRLSVYVVFLLVYVALGVFNLYRRSEWVLDSCIGIVLITAVFFLGGWFLIGRREFILFNAPLLLHNLGSFGLYAWGGGLIAFDNLVHLVSAAVAAYLVFNFVSGRLCLRLSLDSRPGRDNKIMLVLLVLSVVSFLGVFIELLEFFGVMLLGMDGSTIGMLGVGESDAYMDTMTDMIVNLLGSFVGVLVYYFYVFKKSV